MSEEANPPAKPDSENPSPVPAESKKPELSPEQKSEPPAKSEASAAEPSIEKPAIQVGNEQFTSSPAASDHSPSAAEEVAAAEKDKDKEESGPRKILEELEKDLPTEAETNVSPAKEESVSLAPDVVVAPPVTEAPSTAQVSSVSASADELISDAMRRLDDILKKMREEN